MSTATFRTPDGVSLEVDFNPASLKLTVTNTMQDEQPNAQQTAGRRRNNNPPPKQNVRKSATKLETELVFDSTDNGHDVRLKTRTLKTMARPKSANNPAIPQVTFEWGSFRFVGFIESIIETLDFWSGDGVPLRSTVQLVMQSLELDVLAPVGDQQTLTQAGNDGLGTTGVAGRAGDARAGRAIAAANGLESMRMTAGGALAVSGGVQLTAAAGFNAGAGAGLGFRVAAGAGSSFGVGASALGGFGASASAGATAVSGAFDGLGVSKTIAVSLRVDPARLLPAPGARVVGSGASFDLTGRVIATGSAGLAANVGGAAGARVRLV